MYLYHFILRLETLYSILDSGHIFMNDRILTPCVCSTRNPNYLNNTRGIRVVLDYAKLRYNIQVVPFSLRGWYSVHSPDRSIKHLPDEMEERIYGHINLDRHCVRIDIDGLRYKDLQIMHPLINKREIFKI